MSDSFMTPWTIAHQAPLSMEFPRQEYWSGLPYPPGDLFNPGIKCVISRLAGGSLSLHHQGSPDTWICSLKSGVLVSLTLTRKCFLWIQAFEQPSHM